MPTTTTTRETLKKSYDRTSWQSLLQKLFPGGSLSLLRQPEDLAASHGKVTATRQLGTLTLPGDEEKIALLEITTTDQIQLARNRVSLRNFVASFIDQAQASAVLAVFHQPGSEDWRLTFAAKKTTLDQDTFEIVKVETAPRRFTFLLGGNESCRTAAARLDLLPEKKDALGLADLEAAFSVESLTKDFFRKYKEQYHIFIADLFSEEKAAATRELFGIAEIDPDFGKGKANKPVRDFVKTLLGRLVFLTFLQKKGWLGCPAKTKPWKGGQSDFLKKFLEQATAAGEADVFHSKYLTGLFFDALNNESHPDHVFPLTGTRLPYLNGGLFEDDDDHARSIDFPPELFWNLLNFFGEYNFTIDENDPEDHEVGIDPEMLGMIFENLLEDNKEKGTYYTPKAIVSYMARQSLLHYLQTHLGEHADLEKLLKEKNSEDLPPFVAENKESIADLLDAVTICDPAIGSGAFPIGLLHEILWTRLTLEPSEKNTPQHRAELKRSIIQNSIHGVDLDPGAIEIARLRFWLALVVDEDEPRPLPNLDYKIHRADSLIEYIRGEPVNLGTEPPKDTETRKAVDELILAKQELFIAQGLPGKRKAWFQLYRALARVAQAEFTWMRNNEDMFATGERVAKLDQNARDFGRWIKMIDAVKDQKVHLQENLLGKLRAWFDDDRHPTFLWNLHFGGIFADGGFDIVIANPPYVRQELFKPIKPLLQERFETYTGTCDLLVYFYEQAHRLLKENGTLTFITSNKFYRAGYGKKLRQFLSEKQTIRTLIDFSDAPVFNNVIAYASIYIGQKTAPGESNEVEALPWDLSKPAATLGEEIKRAFPVMQVHLTADGWNLDHPVTFSLLLKLKDGNSELGAVVNNRIFAGIKTGFNDAFIIGEKEKNELIKKDLSSADLIKPYIRGKDIDRWAFQRKPQFIIYVPRGTKIDDFPAVRDFILPHRERLEKRALDQKWFELQQAQQAFEGYFQGSKIVYPNVSFGPRFAIDKGGYMDMTTFGISTPDANWIVPILNSNLIYFAFLKIGIERRGGYQEFKTQYVEKLPIPPATDAEKAKLATLAEKCAAAAAKDDAATLAVHEAEINRIVYGLFKLSEEEIALIETSLDS